MLFRSLGFRLVVVLAVALVAGFGFILTFFTARVEDDLLDAKREEGLLLADTIKRSLRFAMIEAENRFRLIPQIIQPISAREEIERIRIYDKNGEIRYSSDPTETGHEVDLKADACNQCHKGEAGEPLQRLPIDERTRIYEAPGSEPGYRVLGVIDAIYNEPACQACHKEKTVLGVLDVVVSLKEMDRSIATNTRSMWVFGVAETVAILLVVILLIHFLVHRPVRALVSGTEKVGQLNLDHRIPADRRDELGELSRAFNDMTGRLKTAQREIKAFSDGLEEKIEEKTRELAAAQNQMVRAEKLAAVGHMAAGVAHEINNPLTGVITLAHLLKRKFEPGSREAEDLETISEEARRCSRIVRGLLDFARGTALERAPVEVNRLLDRSLALVENQALFHNIEIVRDYASDLPRIEVDADRIQQVFLNLVLNGAEAMAEEGWLVLATREIRGEEGFDRAIRIEVTDSGHGITEEHLSRIFDPFFTTKEPGAGTGLGLAVSYGIISEHGGKIVVKSEVGSGTTFFVYLPVTVPEGGRA